MSDPAKSDEAFPASGEMDLAFQRILVARDFYLVTPDQFRRLALAFPDAVESSHMNHPDSRIGGKVFATLGYPNEGWAMVKLTPDQQNSFVRQSPSVFRPCKGVWGERGATNVRLDSADKALVQAALQVAHKNVRATVKKVRGRKHVQR
jgi:YjbR